jgi:hypothetical protein
VNTSSSASAVTAYRRHAALAQLHRWFQFHERRDASLKHQLELLRPHVRVRSCPG